MSAALATDLVALARDEAHTARLVVVGAYSTYLGTTRYQVHVLQGDLLWNDCGHSHQTEEIATRCLRRRATSWHKGRSADEIVLVNDGATIEWRWITGHTARGTFLGTSGRCHPYAVGDLMTLIDYGPVDDHLGRR